MTDITESAGFQDSGYTTKDSGKREEYPTGMRRDTQEGKPRYDLVDKAFLKRQAGLMLRGAEKYGEDNWRLAATVEEWSRFRASGNRHMEQHLEGDRTEDHAAAVAFNLAAEAYVEARLKDMGYTLTWPWPGVPQWMDPPPDAAPDRVEEIEGLPKLEARRVPDDEEWTDPWTYPVGLQARYKEGLYDTDQPWEDCTWD